MSYSSCKIEEVVRASLLYEMQEKGGNQESAADHDEE